MQVQRISSRVKIADQRVLLHSFFVEKLNSSGAGAVKGDWDSLSAYKLTTELVEEEAD